MMISARPPLPFDRLLGVQAPRLRPQVEQARGRRTRRSTAGCPRARCRPAAPSPTRARRPGPCAACRSRSAPAWRSAAGRARSPTSRARRRRPGGPRLTATCSAMLATRPGLAHARAGGEDDQVAGLKAAGDLVEVGEARRGPGDLGLAAGELLEPVDLAREDVLEHVEVLGLLLVGDVEEQLLGPLGELAAARPRGRGRTSGSSARRRAAGAGASSAGRSARSGGRCPATGTVEARLETASRPPASSSSPCWLSSSETVSASIGSLRS